MQMKNSRNSFEPSGWGPAGKREAYKLLMALAIPWLFACPMASGQTPTTVVTFDVTNGFLPYFGSMVQGANGDLYGTTYEGGANGAGTIFKLTPAGTLTTLHSFDTTDGAFPGGSLLLATNGDLYGTTWEGGSYTNGTIFKITPAGVFTSLHSFDSTDGELSVSGLIQATNGDLYGTTYNGGANGLGTVFKITPAGVFTSVHSFVVSEGTTPYAGLIQGTDGYLYGTTYQGGANGVGTVFKITAAGVLTVLYSFTVSVTDGTHPYAALVQADNGLFYGSTSSGGGSGYGAIFSITPEGALTILHSFAVLDGDNPQSRLIQANDGNLYGTTSGGGTTGTGTIFKMTLAGTLTSLFSFDGTNGSFPIGGLVQHTDGTLYGTTWEGGTHNDGTVFTLSEGLGPFVETVPTSGRVGAAVKILGTHLSAASSVTFNGTAAVFHVVGPSEITATVPAGATTGNVQVATPGGVLVSNVAFQVP
jgi:uncharacterized repeat protein (TIGR03803 family)